MTMAIGHQEDGKAVIDLVREIKPPFSPESVVDEFVAALMRYKVFAIRGNRYAGLWPREQLPTGNRHATQPSQALVNRLEEAKHRREWLLEAKADVALAASSGSKTAINQFQGYEWRVDEVNREIETLELAVQAFDRKRVDEEDKRQAQRIARANARKAKLVELFYKEQAPQYRETIRKFRAQGNVQQALIWERELDGLRATLERQAGLVKGAA